MAREEKAGQGKEGRRRLEECWPDLSLCHYKVSAWVRGEGEPSQCAYPWWGRGNILIQKLLV